ncbi:hypothetical protein VPNG_09264 [Cytospora leucostoma]|uniref:Micro-fibrillar-associated protein 1 C-terminal domain-containing protein n=1 Tax=Cytospora leucostoma TaxID=1230097 RepID=A0A423W0H6_9PEZI|nr:hypothetical protein VPNG_09264 [Cytospora leucostoma]
MPPKRMTANPIKPSRHRAGKPTRASDSSSSESEASDAEAETKTPAPKKRTIAPPPKVPSAGRIISTNTVKQDDSVKKRAAARQRAEIERKAREEGFVTEDEDDEEGEGEAGAEESGSDDESGSEEGSSSSEEDESSEEEAAPRRLMIRPKFISKAARAQTQEDPLEREQALEAQRRADADALVEAQIQKDIAARAAGKKHWDDDSGSEADEVDDADGADPEAELAAWRLRELRRLKRAREAVEAREAEIAEKERRQALTEEERAAEDEALVARQREEKEGRGKMGFMQKYYHKGAFYQDDLKTEGLDKRDLMGARFADEVKNRELLPQALQMRDMTKLGKKGASKYKDLKSEDTGSWGRFDDPRRQRDQQWDRYRDGDRDGPGGGGGGGDFGGQGANAMPLGRRRSRSPRWDRDDDRERKREYSRERDRHDDDKRRRVDSR